MALETIKKELIKVETKTLEQISSIVETSPEGQQLLQKTIIEAVEKLWQTICSPKATLILIEETVHEIQPKPEYQEVLKKLTGTSGPYTTIKTCKSWTGLSEGVYQLKDCSSFVPVSWFNNKQTISNSKIGHKSLLIIVLIILSTLQSLFLLLLLL